MVRAISGLAVVVAVHCGTSRCPIATLPSAKFSAASKITFLRNVGTSCESELCVQCALHENHASWPLGRDHGTWDVYVSRGAAACGACADSAAEFGARDGGGLQNSQWGRAGAASAERAAQGGEAGAAEIVLGIDRGSSHSRRAGHASIRIHVAGLRREGSHSTTISAAACAGVLRFRRVVCHRNQLLGWKMARSERCHKIWWVPQVATMAGNLAGYGDTRAHPAPP